MPLSKYFGGHGESVMKEMVSKHGSKKGKQIFYATSNKRKKKKGLGPSENFGKRK